jgi:hypothetical protein
MVKEVLVLTTVLTEKAASAGAPLSVASYAIKAVTPRCGGAGGGYGAISVKVVTPFTERC